MAKDGEAMKKTKAKRSPRDTSRDNLPEWPPGKPFPHFKDLAEEEKFYMSWSFAEDMGAGTEDLVYEPQATRHPRTLVYRVRFDEYEMAKLQRLAKRRGVSGSDIVREWVHAAR
jgi:hypothetical protein